MKKVFNWICFILLVIVLLAASAILALDSCEKVIFAEFLSEATSGIKIPGLDMPYTPQGLTYSPEKDCYIFCGYMNDSTNSKIFIVDNQTEQVKEINLQKEDGSVYNGHAGGISVYKDHVFLSNASKIFHVSLERLLQAENNSYIAFDGSYPVETKASYCFSDNQYLYVGEFYQANKSAYATKDTHHITTTSGKEQCALVAAYPLNEEADAGFDLATDFYFSTDSLVQGFCVSQSGKIILSTSSGISFSHLLIYQDLMNLPYSFNETLQKNIYHLDESSLIKDVKMPPMSEDLTYYDGEVYINFESACQKYRIFNIWESQTIYHYSVA